MGWFSGRFKVNTNETLSEGSNRIWSFDLSKTVLMRISVQRLDGAGPNVYIIPKDEYYNYFKGLLFNCMTSLSYQNIEYFSAEEYLSRGSYYLIAELGNRSDGIESYSIFNLRCEELV